MIRSPAVIPLVILMLSVVPMAAFAQAAGPSAPAAPAGPAGAALPPASRSPGDQGLTSTEADREAALEKALEEQKALAAGTHPMVIPDLQKIWAKQDDDDLAGKNGVWARLKTAFRLGRWGVLFKTALPYLAAALVGAVLALGFANRRGK